MLVHAVLTAVLEWANYQPVVLASVECLRTMLHYLSSGKHQGPHTCYWGGSSFLHNAFQSFANLLPSDNGLICGAMAVIVMFIFKRHNGTLFLL